MKDVFKKALPYLALSLLLACLAIALPLDVGEGSDSVSYTHLTLPTNSRV